jgi:hypothetical protein
MFYKVHGIPLLCVSLHPKQITFIKSRTFLVSTIILRQCGQFLELGFSTVSLFYVSITDFYHSYYAIFIGTKRQTAKKNNREHQYG